MISIQNRKYGLDVALFGEFTLDDFKAYEAAVLQRAADEGVAHVLFDLSALIDFTLDMALEELRFVRAHAKEFGHLAIVAPDSWISLAAHIAGLLTHVETRYFDSPVAARDWLMATAKP